MEQERKYCAACKYFIQHYRKGNKGKFSEVHCGHCVHPMVKNRAPDTPACKYFEEKQ